MEKGTLQTTSPCVSTNREEGEESKSAMNKEDREGSMEVDDAPAAVTSNHTTELDCLAD